MSEHSNMNNSHGPVALALFSFIVRDSKHYLTFLDVQTMEWIANLVSTISSLAAIAWVIWQWRQAHKNK